MSRVVLDPVRDPRTRLNVGDVAPLPTFSDAASTVLAYLHATYPFGLWVVSRTAGADWVVLSSAGDAYPVAAGTVLPWADSFCSRMVRGEGPRVAPRVADVPAYADAPIARLMPDGGYVGVPLTGPDGELFGTLCAVDAQPLDDGVRSALPLFQLQARLLSSLLSVELTAAAQARRAGVAELMAGTDALTGVLNRRGWNQTMDAEQVRSRRHASPVSVTVLDLDGLKTLNDGDGHAAGDDLLLRTGRLLQELGDPGDSVARTGGDEFALLWPGLPEACAQVRATRVQELLRDAGIAASCGVSAVDPRDGDLTHAWTRADAAMYADKRVRSPRAAALG